MARVSMSHGLRCGLRKIVHNCQLQIKLKLQDEQTSQNVHYIPTNGKNVFILSLWLCLSLVESDNIKPGLQCRIAKNNPSHLITV
jgi:hypothetical protein